MLEQKARMRTAPSLRTTQHGALTWLLQEALLTGVLQGGMITRLLSSQAYHFKAEHMLTRPPGPSAAPCSSRTRCPAPHHCLAAECLPGTACLVSLLHVDAGHSGLQVLSATRCDGRS
jgi:hypothetical protein